MTHHQFLGEICHTLLGRKSDLNVHLRKQHSYQEVKYNSRFLVFFSKVTVKVLVNILTVLV